jgi:hypothetical protein
LSEIGRRTRLNKDRVHAVGEKLSHSAYRRGDNRLAQGEGFKKGDRYAFTKRWQYEHV